MNNFSQQSLWSVLRKVAEYEGVGHCWVWTNIASTALEKAGYRNVVPFGARLQIQGEGTDIQNFIKTSVPEGNIFKVKSNNIREAVEAYNKRPDIQRKIEIPSIPDAEYIGYVPGIVNAEAILDGTADQVFDVGQIPSGLENGFYGTNAFLPRELVGIYNNAIPWRLGEDSERRTV